MAEMMIRAASEAQLLTGTVNHFALYRGPLDTVLDIGAHVGELSIAAAQRGAKRVWAVEPDADNYRTLLINILANEFADRIIPLQMAVWIDNGVVTLKRCGGNTGQRSLVYRPEVVTAQEIVPGVTLETLLTWTGPVDYCKLDVEGLEHLLLQIVNPEAMRQVKVLDLDLHDITDREYFEGLDGIDQQQTRACLRRMGFPIGERTAQNEWMLLEREVN